jgi:CRP-like cAMP-binding protein
MAESSDPKDQHFTPKVVPKSAQATLAITDALRVHFLFADLEEQEMASMVSAMFEQRYNVGDVVIRQGDKGDNFYCVQKGAFDILVNNQKVAFAGEKQCFGELALLYNCPRAASVVACGPSTVWAIDRVTFRYILAHASSKNKTEVKTALKTVSLLENLTDQQISKVADVVQLAHFQPGEYIIRKGERGHVFYIIKTGSVLCTEVGAGQKRLEDVRLNAGEYFGERALLTDEPRAANVLADSNVTCMVLDRDAFTGLLGPLHAVLARNDGKRVLMSVPILKSLSDDEREAVMDAFVSVSFQQGQQIIRQGDQGNTFYIIREGVCAVTQASGRTQVEVAALSAGEYFGEMALVNDEARQASVSAKSKVECFMLERKQFEQLLGPLKDLLRRSVQERQDQNASLNEPSSIRFEDCEMICTLGTGTFGRVKLVRHRTTAETYAMKILQKAQIVAFQQQVNVLTEKKIMAASKHPFILELVASFKVCR